MEITGAGLAWTLSALLAAVLGLAALPWLRFLDEPDGGKPRWHTIDGLRGFLALGVLGFHLALYPRFLRSGVWAPPEAPFAALLGPVGVSLFFMVTGFLFWSMLLRTRGRPGWRALYVGRVMRIGPLYLAVVAAMLAVVAWRSGFSWHVSPAAVAGAVAQWLALGIVDTQPDVNGVIARHVLAGVTWTLFWEWAFYAALVLLAPFARGRPGAHALAFTVLVLVLCLLVKRAAGSEAAGFAALFACGMVAASALQGRAPSRRWPAARSALALACLAAAFALGDDGYSTPVALLLAAFFVLVADGATLFGLLSTPAAQRLGRISYGLYLMQGLALTAAFAAPPVRQWALGAPPAFAAVGLLAAAGLVGAAALAHVAIEKPAIVLARRWRARAQRTVNRVAAKAAFEGLKMPTEPLVAPAGTVS